MPNGKTRDASCGPWIASADIDKFVEFCKAQGKEVRTTPALGVYANYQVRHNEHWMQLSWNKAFRRFTADRRLGLIVQSFAASKCIG